MESSFIGFDRRLTRVFRIGIIIGLIIGVPISGGIDFYIREVEKSKHKSEIKPCECLSYEKVIMHHEKAERFLDELQRAKKEKRNALIDSINYHRTLSGINCNAIEY